MAEKCEDHTGCLKDISHLQESDRDQWTSIGKNRDRIDLILTRVNVTLGCVTVSCILLAINLVVNYIK